jgi:MFS family permease
VTVDQHALRMTRADRGTSSTIGDDERWAAAESILDGSPTQWARPRMRRQRRLIVSIIIGLGLLGGVIGGLVVAVGGNDDLESTHNEASGWQLGAGLVLGGAGLVVMIVGLVLLLRSPGWRPV